MVINMKTIKKISLLLFCAVLLFSMSSCKSAQVNRTIINAPFSKLSIPNKVNTGTVAENENFLLDWDQENVCIKLTSKQTGEVWSSIPSKFLDKGEKLGKAAVSMRSPINISYVNESNMSAVKTLSGYTGVVKKGHIGTTEINNGLKVYYSFDNVKIIIPVSYTLTEEGLNVSVNPKEIIEYDKLVYSITLVPFLCSSENVQTKENYLVVPSGSGALMYTDNRNDGARTYFEMVYGADPSCYRSEKLSNTETVRLPVYGAKDGNSFLGCVIKEGAPCAEIEAQTGNSEIGFSNVCTTFHIRGSNISSVDFQGGNVKDVETVCESIGGYKKLSVFCYPISGENANYSGLAKKYSSTQLDGKKTSSKANLTLNIIGGLQTDKLLLGIPQKKTMAATTFLQAKSMVESVSKDCNTDIDVVLIGFGTNGIDIGEIAGGYAFSDVFGSKKDFNALKSLCDKNNIKLYVDYDVVRYNKSSHGFSKMFDSAKTSNLFTAYQYLYSPALRQTLDGSKYVLLNRDKTFEASEKLLKNTNKMEIENIGLSTLGNISYSDYSSVKYYVRSSTESDFSKIAKSIKDNKKDLLLSDPNAYAAKFADKIIDSPVNSSLYDCIDEDIPLYQMVYRGYTNISNKDINLLDDQMKGLLKAVESGSGLAFSLINKYDTEFATTTHSEFATSLFENNKDTIKEYVYKTSEFYKSIGTSAIDEHKIIDNDLRVTKFSNGVEVVINYSNEDKATDYGTVKANDFLLIKKEVIQNEN